MLLKLTCLGKKIQPTHLLEAYPLIEFSFFPIFFIFAQIFSWKLLDFNFFSYESVARNGHKNAIFQ